MFPKLLAHIIIRPEAKLVLETILIDLGVSHLIGRPHNKDYNILGSILGSPILGNYHLGFRVKGELLIRCPSWC